MARSVFDAPKAQDDDAQKPQDARKPLVRRKPIVKGGAASDKYIRAATQGGADRTYQEISVDQVSDSKIRDRIDINEDLESLMQSIKENGQQIPILVRVVQGDTPYEIVVGRRRLAATRRLGLLKIKAFVSKMDDREAFVAQGIENSARLETSYIERARAAAQGLDAGYEQKDIAEFLNVSRTLINFMVKCYRALGEELVLAIGPARGVGRRPWDKLVVAMEQNGLSPEAALAMVNLEVTDSVERFHDLLRSVQAGPRRSSPSPAPKETAPQEYLGGQISTVRKGNQIVLKAKRSVAPEVIDRLDKEIEKLMKAFEKAQKPKG